MSYDAENFEPIHGATPVPTPTVHPRDLEVIVTLLELAALELHDAHTVFTRDQLVATAHQIAGPGFGLVDLDVDVVLPNFRALRQVRKGQYVLR